jgi:hypothetical protein
MGPTSFVFMLSTRLDHVGRVTSILCAIHCALSPFVLPLLPLMASRFVGPTLEWGFIATTLLLGHLSLVHSYRVIHRDMRAMALFGAGFTILMIVRIWEPRGVIEATGMFGAAVLIVSAHGLNLRLRARIIMPRHAAVRVTNTVHRARLAIREMLEPREARAIETEAPSQSSDGCRPSHDGGVQRSGAPIRFLL